jgi:hypothetical protein
MKELMHVSAQEFSSQRRSSASGIHKKLKGIPKNKMLKGETKALVLMGLLEDWSPEQISVHFRYIEIRSIASFIDHRHY